jgi:hypothetical protein
MRCNFFKNWLFARLQWMDDAMFGSLLNPSAILELAENTANASTIQVKLTLYSTIILTTLYCKSLILQ